MIKHEDMVKVLCKKGEDILSEMTPDDAHLLHMVMGVAGEAGELLDAIKKKIIYRKELDVHNVVEELGDLEFYLCGVRQALNIEREGCLKANIEKLGKRYENFQYTNSAAIERVDKK